MNWLDECEAKLEAATPGPWFAGDANAADSDYGAFWVVSQEETDLSDESPEEWFAEIRVGHREDADFIAASPEMVAKLIAAVRTAHGELATIANYGIDVTVFDGAVESARAMQTIADGALAKLQSGEFPS